MLSKDNIIFHMNNVHGIIRVVLFQVLEDFKLNARLVIIFLLVLNHFKGDMLLTFVIEALQSDTERTFAEELLNLIPISNVIPHNYLIVSFVVVITKVVLALKRALHFLASLANVVDLRVIENFLQFEGSQVLLEILYGLCRSQRKLQVLQTVDRVC